MDSELNRLAAMSLQERSEFPNCFPNVNPLDIYRAHIASLLIQASGLDGSVIFPAISWTLSLEKGDFSIAVPSLRLKGKPDEIALDLISKFPDSPLIHKPTASGPHLQFFMKTDKLTAHLIPMIRRMGPIFGQNSALGLKDHTDPSKGRKRVIVEFSSPNIAKPFHAGHLRSTIIGGFLAHLHERAGWDVVRINYLGDWGKQYGLLALGFARYGDEDSLQSDPISHLYDVYVQINQDVTDEADRIKICKERGDDTAEMETDSLDEQARAYFKKMTDRDEVILAQWRRFRDLSISRYQKTYERLNIRFDSYSGESQVPESAMEAAAERLSELKISEPSDGATIIDFSKHIPGKAGKNLQKSVIRKKDGTALYLTRDISELLSRHETYNFDRMLYVVASQQDLHFKQLFKIIELMGHQDIAEKCQHINFGLVAGMSTRKGTARFLDDILRDVGNKMHEVMRSNDDKYSQVVDPEATADILGISSVMVQDMTGKRLNNYKFNIEVMTSSEGDTGPYLQYAHARLCSIARKAALSQEELDGADLSLLTEEHATNLVRLLSQWPDVFLNTLKTLEPTTILTYLFRMTHMMSSSYDHLRIVGSDPEIKRARMALYDAAAIVLNSGMRLLGLSPLSRM